MKKESKTEAAAVFFEPKQLVPNPKNPRINDSAVDAVANNIEKFGFTSPIVARKANKMVIAGHTRLKAAIKLDLKTVPVRFIDVTQKQADLLTIADNKLGEKATWNDELLREQLSLLQADFDLSIAGYEGTELASLLSHEPSILGDDSLPEGVKNAPGMDQGNRPEGDPSHVRMVQLFFDEKTQPVFHERCEFLGKRWGLTSPTDIVFRVVEEAVKQFEEKKNVRRAASVAG